MQDNGELIASFVGMHKKSFYTTITVGRKLILLGTSAGSLEIWNRVFLKFMKSIGYPNKIRERMAYPMEITNKRQYKPPYQLS